MCRTFEITYVSADMLMFAEAKVEKAAGQANILLIT